MARYQINLAYDGTHFLGSQRQKEARTVQFVLENALRQIGWIGRSILMAGRTDTGVHASGQVAAFDLEWDHGNEDLLKALNANLPTDLAVWSVARAADEFHPRFDARSRCYRYRLFCGDCRDPLRERYAWRVWPKTGDLRKLAGILTGRHDFSAFGTPPQPGGSTVRNIFAANWRRKGDEWIFEVQADAFLYRMVRRLVFLQVATGQGRLEPEDMVEALETGSKLPAGLAPPNGLTLMQVRYDDLY